MADGKDKAASCCGGGHDHAAHNLGHDHSHHDQDKPFAIDPVCGMKVDPKAPKGGRFSYKGTEYVFCSQRCHDRFEVEPEKFLAPKQPEPEAAPGTIYTCPMHPEVRQIGPGSCPKCGMALEPDVISLDDKPILN